jgi:hypothetical protein
MPEVSRQPLANWNPAMIGEGELSLGAPLRAAVGVLDSGVDEGTADRRVHGWLLSV